MSRSKAPQATFDHRTKETQIRLPDVAHVELTDTHRFVAARYPSSGILDVVSNADDLPALLELEGWTDDRKSIEFGTLFRLPRSEWVTGHPHAQVVMAAYSHPAAGGGRFNDASRGAWYAARQLDTAHAEAVHRHTQALAEIGALETIMNVRLWLADFDANFHDLTAPRAEYRQYHDPINYTASQRLARELLALGSEGIRYHSVRRAGGICVACLRPRSVKNVREGGVYQYTWSGVANVAVRKLS